jgi:hypothetical protein
MPRSSQNVRSLVGAKAYTERVKVAASSPRKEWTVLYYLNGNNDLEPNLVADLMELEKVGSSDQVQIVAQLSRAPQKVVHGKSGRRTERDGDWSGTRRYYVTQGSSRTKIKSPPLSSSETSSNHGSAQTLAEFVSWGMKNYPARHTMVVIGDHGQGFAGTGFDYVHKDVLDLAELKEALAQAPVKPDLLMMDACEMGSAEVAYQLRDQAQILIASEEVIGLGGLPHKPLLEHLRDAPKLSPQQLARDIISISSEDTLERLDRGQEPAVEQLAAVKLGKMTDLATCIQRLGTALVDSQVSRARLKEIIGDTQNFNFDSARKPDSDYRDLFHFAELLQQEGVEPGLQKAAAQVQQALKNAVLDNHCSGEEVSEGHGLSVYLPPHPIRPTAERKAPNGKAVVARSDFSYQETDFDQATGWSAWLKARLG